LFSSLTVRHIGDTFVLYHCLDMLDLYRAHAQSTDDQAHDMNTAVKDVLRPLHTLHMRYLLSLVGNEIGILGCPDADRFKFPIDKRSTEKTIQRVRESETNLDVFWAAVDAYQQEKGLSTDRLLVLLSTKTIRRTPVWKASASKSLISTAKPEIQFLSSYYRDLQLRTEETLRQDTQPIPRDKGKTKGTAQPVEQPPGVREGDEERFEQPPTRYLINKKHEKVFQTLFFTPGRQGQSVRWLDPLAAMKDVGFSAQKLHGSVWHFYPSEELGLSKSIHIHEPHPNNTMDYALARHVGNRLTRTYGWGSDNFERA
jgi:hypothetical protein